MKLDPKIGRSLKKASPTILTCIGAAGVVATAVLAVKATPKADKVMVQASGRIDRLTTPFSDLYYFHLKSFSGIDLAISKALKEKKNFNEGRFVGWSTAPMPKAA